MAFVTFSSVGERADFGKERFKMIPKGFVFRRGVGALEWFVADLRIAAVTRVKV